MKPVKMNLLDKAINYFSPAAGAKRLKARATSSLLNSLDTSYAAASYTRRNLQSWLPGKGSANADYSAGEQDTVTARSRDAQRNQPLAAAVFSRCKHTIVGTGLKLQSRIDYANLGISKSEATEKENLIEREWEHFAKHCDAERTSHLNKLGSIAIVSAMASGDVFANTPYIERPECEYGLKLQLIESDRVCNPSFDFDTAGLRRGIELDSIGAPVAYNVMSQHPGDDLLSEYKWLRVPAFGEQTGQRRFLHLFDKERPGQVRGVPFLSPVIESLKGLDRYTDAEITAAVIASYYTVFIYSEMGQAPPPTTGTTENAVLYKDDQIALGPGAVANLFPGEKIETANPNRPNASYDPFVRSVYQQIGAALGIPADFLTLAFTSSYSAARAAMLQAWQLIKYWRSLLVEQFYQPLYELWFDEFVALGKIDLPVYDLMTKYYYTRAAWIGPARGAIDENKEVQAAKDRIELGISTLQIETEELQGEDWLDVQKQRQYEKELNAQEQKPQQMQPTRPVQPILTADEIDEQDRKAVAKAGY